MDSYVSVYATYTNVVIMYKLGPKNTSEGIIPSHLAVHELEEEDLGEDIQRPRDAVMQAVRLDLIA
jgi:hypothetical protein